ncbi:AAA domain-containing protein [Fictibacillus enclensis]|uniref:AAA domain-containing protein n=1 Tax=Fictibacillus enclensis TaxID=1017270 RepID=UPI0024BF8E76|nr:AAA domain-containing protein [Fictibacillus enclensis]WHY72883.1 AAA domain-containing protein [Fictibacillus enclensis]
MNYEEILILIKEIDKTNEVEWYNYENNRLQIKFINNSTVYKYNNYNHIKIYQKPKLLDHANFILYHDDNPIEDIKKVIEFEKYIKIIKSNEETLVYPQERIVFEKSKIDKSSIRALLCYFKELAGCIDDANNNNSKFLSNQFKELNNISPRCVLSSYLGKKTISTKDEIQLPIFPFGFNLSQKVATENALSAQISVIEGPPGTGKTQTILNIIANAVLEDKSVAVVSNNNSATANIVEKLNKYGLDFITAFLGNMDNQKKFFEEQSGFYPEDLKKWVLPDSEFNLLKDKLEKSHQQIAKILNYQNSHAKLKQELSELKIEYKYFKEYYFEEKRSTSIKLKSFLKLNEDKLLHLLIKYEQDLHKETISINKKIYNLIAFGIYNFKLYDHSPEEIISYLQENFYRKKIASVSKEIKEMEEKLTKHNFEQKMMEYQIGSMKLFKAKLANKYKFNKERLNFQANKFKESLDFFIDEYPVILSTTHSLRNCVSQNYLFDYVIIDEASQVDILTGVLALSCAKNTVVVGDLQQLSNIVDKKAKKSIAQLCANPNLPNGYNYLNHSLLSSFLIIFKDVPKVLLKEHYRCHPKIISFCNKRFYQNKLVILTNEGDNDSPLLFYKTVKGNHARGTLNQRQIEVIFDEILTNKEILVNPDELIGIISPFCDQKNEIQKTIDNKVNMDAETVHKYQGRERDTIILSTVVNEANDFVDSPNLINVAVSRAVNRLVIVGAENSDRWKGSNLSDLVRYIQYNNFKIIDSRIRSVFDLLYSSYSEQRLKYLKNRKKVSDFDSENLMNAVIEKILNKPGFHHLGHILHQPLKMLVRDYSLLNNSEKKYVMNISTHTDFVLFNKVDKMPILVVEIDGHAYHAENPSQLKRDNMKDEILKKCNIPIIRFKTTGSGEEEKLESKLLEVMKIKSFN